MASCESMPPSGEWLYITHTIPDFGGRCSVCTLHTGNVTYIIENKINLTAMSSYRLAELAIVCRRTSICWSGIPNSAWLRAPVSSWGSNLKYSVIKYSTWRIQIYNTKYLCKVDKFICSLSLAKVNRQEAKLSLGLPTVLPHSHSTFGGHVTIW